MAELEDVFRSRKILESVNAEITNGRRVRESIQHEVVGRLREHRLTAVGQVAEARRSVDGLADVVPLVTPLHIAGVEADPHQQRLAGERLLDGERALQRVTGA